MSKFKPTCDGATSDYSLEKFVVQIHEVKDRNIADYTPSVRLYRASPGRVNLTLYTCNGIGEFNRGVKRNMLASVPLRVAELDSMIETLQALREDMTPAPQLVESVRRSLNNAAYNGHSFDGMTCGEIAQDLKDFNSDLEGESLHDLTAAVRAVR